MIHGFIKFRGLVFAVKQGHLVNAQPRLAALAEGKQNEGNFAALLMAHQAKPLGLQIFLCAAGDQLGQPLRLVDQKKVAAEFDGPCSCLLYTSPSPRD